MFYVFLAIWWILAITDLSLTYITIAHANKIYANTDCTRFEKNKLPSFFIKNFGLKLGILVHCAFMIPIIYLAVYFLYVFTEPLYFVFGIGIIIGFYFLLTIIHLLNYQHIKFLKSVKSEKDKKQVFKEYVNCKEKEFELFDKLKE